MPGPGEWTTYQFPDAGFTVRLPAAPTHTSTAETAPFAAETMYHEVLAEGEDWLFLVGVWLYRSRPREMLDRDVDYDAVVAQVAEAVDVLTVETVDVDWCTGREVAYLHDGRTAWLRLSWLPESLFAGGASASGARSACRAGRCDTFLHLLPMDAVDLAPGSPGSTHEAGIFPRQPVERVAMMRGCRCRQTLSASRDDRAAPPPWPSPPPRSRPRRPRSPGWGACPVGGRAGGGAIDRHSPQRSGDDRSHAHADRWACPSPTVATRSSTAAS
jgi:hypothetical protein